MADLTTNPILSVIATNGNRLSDLVIKDGQLIFVRNKHTIALDFGGKRTFYNQIVEVDTDEARAAMEAPESGLFYFVIDTATLWTYRDKWIPLTTPPKEILFIGTELPELGASMTLYVDTDNNEISVWNDADSKYVVVANKTSELSVEEVDAMFRIN